MLVEELQTVTVDLNGTPRMRFNQIGKVVLQLLGGESIGTAIVVLRNPAYCAGVDIYGAVAHPLKLQCPEVTLVELVESGLLAGFHHNLLCHRAQNRAGKEFYT